MSNDFKKGPFDITLDKGAKVDFSDEPIKSDEDRCQAQEALGTTGRYSGGFLNLGCALDKICEDNPEIGLLYGDSDKGDSSGIVVQLAGDSPDNGFFLNHKFLLEASGDCVFSVLEPYIKSRMKTLSIE